MNTYAEKSSITGLILAGGRGTRMNNLDKGLQQLNGKSLVQHVIERIQPQVWQLAINANRNLEDYRRYGLPVWPDTNLPQSIEEHDFKGPLAGLLTGLLNCSTPYLLTVPCDTPFLPTDLAQRMQAAIGDADVAIACNKDPASPDLQPAFSLVKTNMLPSLQRYLAAGGRKMNSWFGDAKAVRVFFADEAAFRNINTLEDLRSCANESKQA